jgi:hypothetical protein
MARSEIEAPTYTETTWFCCGTAWGPCGGTGRGACGTCNSGSLQCAWPNTSDACFDITRPDRCGDTALRRTCGHTFYITSRCNGNRVTVRIADCGPQTDLWCGERTCCGGNCATNRLMDLTPAAFSRIGSLSSGRLPVRVSSEGF